MFTDENNGRLAPNPSTRCMLRLAQNVPTSYVESNIVCIERKIKVAGEQQERKEELHRLSMTSGSKSAHRNEDLAQQARDPLQSDHTPFHIPMEELLLVQVLDGRSQVKGPFQPMFKEFEPPFPTSIADQPSKHGIKPPLSDIPCDLDSFLKRVKQSVYN